LSHPQRQLFVDNSRTLARESLPNQQHHKARGMVPGYGVAEPLPAPGMAMPSQSSRDAAETTNRIIPINMV